MTYWDCIPLESIAANEPNSFVDGPFGSSLKADEYTEEGVPIIRLQNIRPNRFLSKQIKFVSQQKAKDLARHSYCPGDLVIAKLGDPCGMACVLPDEAGEGRIVADVVRFRGQKDKVDHQFLSYYINSPMGRMAIGKDAKGATRQRVNLSNFKALRVPLPPLHEQRRIVSILDQADALRGKRREALAQLDSLTQSIFIEMFGDPIRNPKGWPMVKLEDFFQFRTGKLDSNAAVLDGTYPFFTCAKEDYRIDSYAFDCEALLLAGNNANADYSVKHYKGKFNAYQRTYVITLKNPANAYRYSGFFLENHLAVLKQVSKGSSTKYLTLGLLNKICIPVPPPTLQHKFGEKIEALSQVRASHMESQSELDNLFTALQHRAFSGEL